MRTVVNDEGSIAASGRGKDDRVIGAALAHWIWIQSLKGHMVANRRTYAMEMARAKVQAGSAPQLQRNVLNYLRHSGIKVGP